MIPKLNRLRKTADIDRVFKNGRGLKQGLLLLKESVNGLEYSRFCFIVSLRVAKKAVLRNKIRRRLSEIIRLKLPEIKKGLDIILTALSGMEKKSFQETEKTVDDALTKAKII